MDTIDASLYVDFADAERRDEQVAEWTSIIQSLAKPGAGGSIYSLLAPLMGPAEQVHGELVQCQAIEPVYSTTAEVYDSVPGSHGLDLYATIDSLVAPVFVHQGLNRQQAEAVRALSSAPRVRTWAALLTARTAHT